MKNLDKLNSVQCLLPRLNQPCKGSLVNMQLKQVALGITQRLKSIFGSNTKDHHSMNFEKVKFFGQENKKRSVYTVSTAKIAKKVAYILT